TPPFSGGIALGEEGPARRDRSPMLQPLGQLRRIGPERVQVVDRDRAVGPQRHRHIERTEFHVPQPLHAPLPGGMSSLYAITNGASIMASQSDITYELDGAIALIGLDRPAKRNAINDALV